MYDYMCKITCDLLYKSHVIIYVGRVAALRRQNFDLRQNEISGPDSFSRSFFQCSFSFEPPSNKKVFFGMVDQMQMILRFSK